MDSRLFAKNWRHSASRSKYNWNLANSKNVGTCWEMFETFLTVLRKDCQVRWKCWIWSGDKLRKYCRFIKRCTSIYFLAKSASVHRRWAVQTHTLMFSPLARVSMHTQALPCKPVWPVRTLFSLFSRRAQSRRRFSGRSDSRRPAAQTSQDRNLFTWFPATRSPPIVVSKPVRIAQGRWYKPKWPRSKREEARILASVLQKA